MKPYFLILTILFSVFTNAQGLDTFFNKTDSFLKAHVKNGKVDYETIYNNQKDLNAILSLAEGISVSISDAKNYQAFWINAYNIATIKGIIDNYPINSPLDKKGFFDKTTYNLGGKQITLNTIENKLLRANFNDPRVHFVLVCGAVGCPPLIDSAYKPETLDAQLTAQTKKAINGNFIKVNFKKKRVQVSQIMEWYKEDFIKSGNEIDFLNTYLEEKLSPKTKLSYFPYNWELNKQ